MSISVCFLLQWKTETANFRLFAAMETVNGSAVIDDCFYNQSMRLQHSEKVQHAPLFLLVN
jgi:hypothetical protein